MPKANIKTKGRGHRVMELSEMGNFMRVCVQYEPGKVTAGYMTPWTYHYARKCGGLGSERKMWLMGAEATEQDYMGDVRCR